MFADSQHEQRSFMLDAPWNIRFANDKTLVVIAGPCVMESLDFALHTAETLKRLCSQSGLPFIYKSSFDKANRTSLAAYRGVGLDAGLEILLRVKDAIGVPVLTDVHTVDQVQAAAEVVDMLQTPAFLCRQTDFIQAVAAAGKPVNIKKGQFLSPSNMNQVLEKALATGNPRLTLCERGTMFGYGDLVVDMRSLVVMARTGFPVVFDATHSVQSPGGLGCSSGGRREFVPPLARGAAAVGVAAIFLETHPEPEKAPCDGLNMLAFAQLPQLLAQIKAIDAMTKGY